MDEFKDTRYRNATCEGKKIDKLHDGNGLYLWVFQDGRKYWRLRYWINGSEKSLSLGVYPVVGLKDLLGLIIRRKTEQQANA